MGTIQLGLHLGMHTLVIYYSIDTSADLPKKKNERICPNKKDWGLALCMVRDSLLQHVATPVRCAALVASYSHRW